MNKKQVKSDVTLGLVLFILLMFSMVLKKLAYLIAGYLSIRNNFAYESITLLNVYYFFILLGLFILLRKNYRPKLQMPSAKGIISFVILFMAYLYVAHVAPVDSINSYVTVLLEEIFFFSMMYLLGIWALNDSFEKNKDIITKMYFITVVAIVFTLFAWYYSFLVTWTVALSSFLLNLIMASSVQFVAGNSAIFTTGNFSVNIGTNCSGIESAVLFLSLIALIYTIENKRIKNTNKFILWTVIGWAIVFLLNVMRVVLIMLIGVKNPEFAITLFHEYSGMFLFLGFMLPYTMLLYRYVIKK